MFDALHTPDNVLVVGGSSEIGLEIAKQLARRGSSKFLLAGRSLEEMQRAARQISQVSERAAASVSVIHYDVLAEGATESLLAAAKAELETIDMAVIAVGALGNQASDEKDPAAAERILEVNFSKLAPAVLAIANQMATQGFGHIVVLSSVAGVRVRRSNFIYGAAKAGMDGFATALADAMIPSGVKVTVVRPGFVTTKMTAHLSPAPLSTTAAKVAAETLRAADRGKVTVWVPPLMAVVATVYRHLPRVVARRVPF